MACCLFVTNCNNYSKRKPNIIVFIIVNNSQRILIEDLLMQIVQQLKVNIEDERESPWNWNPSKYIKIQSKPVVIMNNRKVTQGPFVGGIIRHVDNVG